jgi:hypothetical protein
MWNDITVHTMSNVLRLVSAHVFEDIWTSYVDKNKISILLW